MSKKKRNRQKKKKNHFPASNHHRPKIKSHNISPGKKLPDELIYSTTKNETCIWEMAKDGV